MAAPVVVASDLSDYAAEALRYALRFRPAPVHLSHVHDFHVHDLAVPGPYGTKADEAIRDGDVRTVLGRGAPAIVERAAALNADLVVVGTGQRKGAARALGSVAGRVLRTARRPVLVVPTPSIPQP